MNNEAIKMGILNRGCHTSCIWLRPQSDIYNKNHPETVLNLALMQEKNIISPNNSKVKKASPIEFGFIMLFKIFK
jgi:hypothetical protein